MIVLHDFTPDDPTLYVDPARIIYVETVPGVEDERRITVIHLDGATHTLRVRETPADVLRLKTAWANRGEMAHLPASELICITAVAMTEREDGEIAATYLLGLVEK